MKLLTLWLKTLTTGIPLTYSTPSEFKFSRDFIYWTIKFFPSFVIIIDIATPATTNPPRHSQKNLISTVKSKAKRVIGIEYVPEAIKDAKENAVLNNLDNIQFFAGDMKDILTDDFVALYGRPDVIITDPPRAGMHNDVISTILFAAPKRIVYVSCNPATQARDVSLLSTDYHITKVQSVDMFPQTHHVENVLLMERNN